MAKKTQIEIFGVKELDDFFSYRLGTKPLVTTARSLLKSRMKTKSSSNNLYKSIGFVAGRSRGKSVFISAKVGARKYGKYRGFHGHLYDAGTTQRQTKRGFDRGKMPASHFFTDALSSTENQIINLSQEDYLKALDKLIASKLRRQKKALNL
jgi:hypothetical protein